MNRTAVGQQVVGRLIDAHVGLHPADKGCAAVGIMQKFRKPGRARAAESHLPDSLHFRQSIVYRGGAVASLFKDRYLGFSVVKSRAFKEWRLLKKMQQLGLPVPQAVAAHVKKSLLSYTADLITEEIKQARTLADILSETGIEAAQWHKIGDRIRLFHLHDVYHADLNARNILLAATAQHPRPEAGDVYLIDFDNSGFRPGSGSWKMANLARLKRSLLKFKRNDAGFNFDEADWSALLAGYKGGVAE